MGKSTTADAGDVFYRLSKSEGYRARSAHKLLGLDAEFDLFSGVQNAVDLCACPGSWSQVLVKSLNRDPERPAKIVAVDLQPMARLQGVTQVTGDITLQSTAEEVISAMGGLQAELVICDGAPDVAGLHVLDAHLHAQLLLAALSITLRLLAPGGTFVAKIFRTTEDPRSELLVSQLRTFFPERVSGGGGVCVRKPASSRPGSGEAFIVCQNFDPTAAFAESSSLFAAFPLSSQSSSVSISDSSTSYNKEAALAEKRAAGWVRGGDLSAWD